MNNTLLLIAIASVLIGMLCGGLVVFLVFTARQKLLANSLDDTRTLVGHIGTVQIPFSYDSKGKIRIYMNNSIEPI